MKKIYLSLYTFTLIFLVVLFANISVADIKNSKKHYFPTTGYTEWKDFSAQHNENTLILKGNIDITDGGNSLIYYISHVVSKVYCNGELIYEFPIVNTNPFAKSPGYSWNFISLPAEHNEMEIILYSPYDGYTEKAPTFYVGDTLSILGHIIHKDMFSFIICILTFVLGAGMVLYWFYLRTKAPIKSNLLFLGLFAISMSIWSINELLLFVLILENNMVSSYISFIMLAICPIPYALFVRSYYQDDHKIWDVLCIANAVRVIICIMLQLFKICDLKHTLWTTHVTLFITIAIVVVRTIRRIGKKNFTTNIKTHLICIAITTTCISIDLVLFCTFNDKGNIYSRFGFALYVALLGFSTLKESITLMQLGKKADIYRTLAFTDQTTKLNNRTAFNADFEQLSLAPEDVCIINFDLNNLKKINDTKGHAFGDLYITSAARIISDTFSKQAKCYRVGGDEFIVLITQYSKLDLEHYLSIFDTKIIDFNNSQDDFDLQIAYGYACYDPEVDNSLNHTNSRADKYMYEDKIRKKQGKKESVRE